ncbi:hypothetical protein [Burkholderia vietnamiensis]|uniref:hypothetical protein n=1 Tax=Burkholderia vietnamiensis TaxID=60552 RepID=UPI000753635C|nr:hypothetical protein [Burkholderia vietnamiensis]KVS12328.1 hypothetical protein WK29_17660 [Burkholderia vietnamiensis]
MIDENEFKDVADGIHDESTEIKPYQTLLFGLKGDKVESTYGACEGTIASDVDYITQCMRISGNVNTCFGEVEQVGREVLRSA